MVPLRAHPTEQTDSARHGQKSRQLHQSSPHFRQTFRRTDYMPRLLQEARTWMNCHGSDVRPVLISIYPTIVANISK